MESVIEGNKLIIGFAEPSWKVDGDWVYKDGNRWFITTMKYHSSWDLLMPVVEKIETGNYGFKMCRKVVEVYFDDSKEVVLKTKEKCRIDSLWLAVVQFIQFHNTQTSKP